MQSVHREAALNVKYIMNVAVALMRVKQLDLSCGSRRKEFEVAIDRHAISMLYLEYGSLLTFY